MTTNLGTLKKIDLRSYWAHEALDFTRWLAREENISLLSDEIGISLTEVQAEEAIGRYNVDLVAVDEDSKKRVIIENQLEYTDHKHLGQLITYASGYDADVIIWIVKDVREEHQKAVEWLNNNTNAQFSFFLIRMELWQIGESPFAPKFHILVQPNEWAKTLKEGEGQSKELTDTKLSQLEFWQEFKNFTEEHNTSLRVGRKPRAQHWYDISIGTSDANLSLTISSRENLISSGIYIPDCPELYEKLKFNKESISNNLDFDLVWMELENRKASRIKTERTADISIEDNWPEYFLWLMTVAEKMAKEFGKYF
ncbi:hypothetical protein GCM10007103_03420 [Salinimicrobium marinum]|uniref:DUF4268 domain-containing protein n=1 Tax=Salinimicrobium marinum TaxID=680283 RepID=A0A918S7H0_9FLAO|nr:DUF4268 domain-containing protein [Salinimicrobium marinum]GHA25503.1 hypothetical protein GCM10007103_03420 [Salinimicrobium marinum]